MGAIAGVMSINEKWSAEEILSVMTFRGTSSINSWKNKHGSLAGIGIAAIGENPGPVEMKAGERAAVFDGHLINTAALVDDLKINNLSFESEAELVLGMYELYGQAAFEKLEGHFSIGIIDGERVLLARDHLGVRSLYYGFSNGNFAFASEIKALADTCTVVHALPRGTALISDEGIYPLGNYQPEPIALNNPQEWTDRLAILLEEAVLTCAPEGSEVGVWLSGGVDSSVVAALAQKLHGQIHTFSVGLDGAPDLKYAQRVAEHLGTNHHVRIYDFPAALKILEEVIFHLESFDGPLVRSAIGNYLVAQSASDYVSFVYSGEGGDELFAGYSYQKDHTSPLELTLSVQQAIAALHNTALQRVDRSAAAHQTRAGLPFLDPRVVRFALAIPPSLKIYGPDKIDKWPLRKAMEETLPAEIIWRKKAKFWEGTGAADLLIDYAEDQISDSDFMAESNLGLEGRIRSKEELLFYRIYKDHFGNRVPLGEIGGTRHV